MKIYIVRNNDESEIYGVFSSKKKALKCILKESSLNDGLSIEDFSILIHNLNSFSGEEKVLNIEEEEVILL